MSDLIPKLEKYDGFITFNFRYLRKYVSKDSSDPVTPRYEAAPRTK